QCQVQQAGLGQRGHRFRLTDGHAGRGQGRARLASRQRLVIPYRRQRRRPRRRHDPRSHVRRNVQEGRLLRQHLQRAQRPRPSPGRRQEARRTGVQGRGAEEEHGDVWAGQRGRERLPQWIPRQRKGQGLRQGTRWRRYRGWQRWLCAQGTRRPAGGPGGL
ncbi:hypothetical protein LTR66_015195, partial [Elasticomyces elasticus]